MGYKKYTIEGIVSIAPQRLSGELKDIILDQLCNDYEGVIDKNIGVIVAVTDVISHDIGEIVPADPNVFFKVKFSVVSYLPKLHEIVSGNVSQATDFGAFIKWVHLKVFVMFLRLWRISLLIMKSPGFTARKTNTCCWHES